MLQIDRADSHWLKLQIQGFFLNISISKAHKTPSALQVRQALATHGLGRWILPWSMDQAILPPVPQTAFKDTSADVPALLRMSLGMQRNLHIPLYHVKTPRLWLILGVFTPDLASAKASPAVKGCTGNPWLACAGLRALPTEFVSSPTETLVPLYSQGTHSGNSHFCSGTNVLFTGTHQGPLPGQLLHATAAGLPPSCPLLSTWEFEKWGEKIIPHDLTLPHDFKDGSVGLQITFP